MGRSAGSFSGMSVSSISTGTRPTCAFHTAACTTRPGQVDGHGEHAAARAPARAARAGARSRSRDRCAAGSRRRRRSAGSSPSGRAGRRRPAARPRSLAALQWSPGEDAQAARVDAQRLVEAELHREVGRPARASWLAVLVEPARRARGSASRACDHRLVGAAELGVGEQPLPVVRLDVDQQLDRVVVAAPVVGVDPGEEARGLRATSSTRGRRPARAAAPSRAAARCRRSGGWGC